MVRSDPEAAHIVLRAPWKKMTITPIGISVKTRFTAQMKAPTTPLWSDEDRSGRLYVISVVQL